MNKEKLISLIIKKQTYKDTKPYLNDLASGKQNVAKISAQAIRDIITTDYIAQVKLFAVRYLKDAFEKGNSVFINLVENSLLPILVGIAVDETQQKAITKYAGTSYTKNQDLNKFKSILSSLFRICKECILKWASWIPDQNRKFFAAAQELRRRSVNINFEFKYFRAQNQQYFIENCNRNRVDLSANGGLNSSRTPVVKVSSPKAQEPTPQPIQEARAEKLSSKKEVSDPLIEAVQIAMQNLKSSKTVKELNQNQTKFDVALNDYLENSKNFQQDLVQNWFQQFQDTKTMTQKRIKEGKVKESKIKQNKEVKESRQQIKEEKGRQYKPTQSKYVEEKIDVKEKGREYKPTQSKYVEERIEVKQNSRKGSAQNPVFHPHNAQLQTPKGPLQSKASSQTEKQLLVAKGTLQSKASSKTQKQLLVPKGPLQSKSSSKSQIKEQEKKKSSKILEQQLSEDQFVLMQRKDDKKQYQSMKPAEIKEDNFMKSVKKEQKSMKSAIPKSPHKGPIIFDEEQSDFSSKKPPTQMSVPASRPKPELNQGRPAKPGNQQYRSPKGSQKSQSFASQKEKSSKVGSEKKAAKQEKKVSNSRQQKKQSQLQISKDSQRVYFSEQQESQRSFEVPIRDQIPGNFKKKPKLAAIQQTYDQHDENQNSGIIPHLMSKMGHQQGITPASPINKLIPDNKDKVVQESKWKSQEQNFLQQKKPQSFGKTPGKVEILSPEKSRFQERESRLVQEKQILAESITKMSRELQQQKQQKKYFQKEAKKVQTELQQKKQSYDRLLQKVQASVPLDDYNKLKKEYERQKLQKNTSISVEDYNRLKYQLERYKKELSKIQGENSRIKQSNPSNEELQKYKNNVSKLQEQNDRLRQEHRHMLSQFQDIKMKIDEGPSSKELLGGTGDSFRKRQDKMRRQVNSPIRREELDQDYVRNLTHHSHIHNWLSQTNTTLLKRSILNLSQIFYRDQYLTILSRSSLYTQNNHNFAQLTLTLQFKQLKKISPMLKHKNCQQIQMWVKPLSGENNLYTQELVLRIHRNPLKLIKSQLKIYQSLSVKFLLPSMYLNFLRHQQVQNQSFEEMMNSHPQHIAKSKIIQVNTNILKQSADIKKLFRFSVAVQNKIRFCLAEGINQHRFLGQFEMLRNNKVLLKMLPAPLSEQMLAKSRELLDTLTFLLS